MLKRCISAEWMKLRHSRIWMILVILPVISVLVGSANFSVNRDILTKEWYSLWSQVGLFYGEFFLPVLIAVLCAYMWRLEHLNKNWNMIMTAPVSVPCIFLAKLTIAALLLLFIQTFLFILYLIGGKLAGLTSGLPGELTGWFFRGWMASLTIASFQLALSMRIKSFAAPVGIGLCAAFAGLGMYVAGLGMFFPHSLLTIGMGVLSQTGLSHWENIL
ncbi:multidrug ABC transporter permease [Thermoclostridium stercorarium subsp. thermolacticum DSM 2910]|uniref:Multidrug ABC transporter permease n=1 Tax=Thermoclostridium stercorarium subsp. thermolacticum DSM 2910 TaxID=1121336 RepID=A0A1B1YCQ9_THEST|nr:ABC transporter permease [Thermoclostridium stercorarium]ANW98546.1 multidrug ABC transporter permease [Thermoclostridium stercorarium subsp. thermolacticum DSM 2910]